MKKDNYFKSSFRGDYQNEKNNPTNKKKLAEINSLGYKNGILLDIGCAYGFFLLESEKLGFKTYGIDTSSFAITKAKKNTRAKLYKLDLVKQPMPIKKIDVCTFLNSLEHISDYVTVLKKVFASMNKNGLLVLYVPYGNRWMIDETHVNYFTLESLTTVIERCGFKVIKAGYEGGKLQIPFGIFRLITRRNTNFNFVPEFSGSFISCYAVKK